MAGWQIVCPDGHVRHFPYHNRGDAECDASLVENRGCEDAVSGYRQGEPLPPCPGGRHTVEAMTAPVPTGSA